MTAARSEAEHTLSSARAEAEALTTASTAERLRLDAEGAARRKAVDEDFEIAISSRRAEAHQRLTEREELSVADAKQRVADATAESERRVREATEHSAELIRRAAAESHQRVADADQAVQELTALRSHVLDQLASLREHLGQVDKLAASAPALLDPPDTEAGRPVTSDFPVAPGDRPTDLPATYNSEPGPWDQVTVESLRADQDREHQQAGSKAADAETLDALAADFGAEPEDLPVVPKEIADSETDTFSRVEDTTDHSPSGGSPAGNPAGNPAASVPTQQRGLRAFAERAIGGR